MKAINLKLLAHPLNWVTLAIWLLAVGILAVASGLVPIGDNSKS
jgi:hypothetical protein